MAALIVIAGIAGLVWGVVLLQRGGLVAGCLTVLLAGAVFGHPFFHVSAITVDRVLLGGLVVTCFVFRKLGLADPKPLDKADLCFGVFLAVLMLSTATHNWRLDGAQPLATLLFFYLLPGLLYWAGRQSKLTPASIHSVLAFAVAFAVYLALTAIAEWRQVHALVFPRYIASPAYAEFFGRARGPFLNPVACGFYLSWGLIALTLCWSPTNRLRNLGLVAVAAILLLGIYCTLTRSVWLGAGLACCLSIGLRLPRSWRLPAALALVLAAAIVGLWKWNDLSAFKRDRHVSVHQMQESAQLRPILAAVAWKMFLDHPFLGCGFGQYKEVDVNYLHETMGDLPLEKAKPYVQHNVFLALLTQVGAIGLGLWLMTLALWAWHAYQLWRASDAPTFARQHALLFLALLLAYACNGMFHDVSIIVMVNALLFFTAGVNQGLLPAADPASAVVQRHFVVGPPLHRSPSTGTP